MILRPFLFYILGMEYLFCFGAGQLPRTLFGKMLFLPYIALLAGRSAA